MTKTPTKSKSKKREELLERYKKNEYLIHNTIYRMLKQPHSVASSKGMQMDDLVQMGSLGLWQACIEFDEKLSSFRTYAINRIRWSVQSGLNTYNTMKYNHNNPPDKKDMYNIVSLNQSTFNNEEDDLALEEMIADNNNQEFYDGVYSEEILAKLFDSLDERGKKIVEMKLDGLTNKAISKNIGMSESSITYHLKKIRKVFNKITK